MRHRCIAMTVIGGAALCLAIGFGHAAQAQSEGKETAMTEEASGSFEVQLSPQALHHDPGEAKLGRMSIDKKFSGDLEGTSQGEMLSAMTGVQGSAGYVAIELVTGTLHGKSGSFVLQHSSTMERGAPEQNVTVVPDSGTGELEGLAGRMTIDVGGGAHTYTFEYMLRLPPSGRTLAEPASE